MPEDTGKVGTMAELPPECITDGTLDDPVLILKCGGDAIQQLESVVVNATIDFSAMFAGLAPPGDDPVPVMEMELKRVFPDDVDASFTTPDGEEVRMIFLDGAAYVNDPMSNSWAKFSDVTDEMSEMFLAISSFEQQVQEATSENVEWNEVMLSDDGSKYLVSYKPDVGNQGAMFGPALPEFRVTLDAMSFLYESISLVPADDDGTDRKIVDIQYSRHNEPLIIEALSKYTEVSSMMPGGGMGAPGSGDGPEVVGLSKDANGYVEVRFSETVTVTGEVSLYVIDPATGGWELPLLGGAGTDTLTFDHEPEGKPSLIPGESVIPGLIFATAESQILDLEGNMANPVFEEWVYPE
ncbi:MAG: hypothetical protein F4X94_07675 [Dehalococcoidia bacterium]|nr:hypothetical protein [Dehalococcoidia bacterium]